MAKTGSIDADMKDGLITNDGCQDKADLVTQSGQQVEDEGHEGESTVKGNQSIGIEKRAEDMEVKTGIMTNSGKTDLDPPTKCGLNNGAYVAGSNTEVRDMSKASNGETVDIEDTPCAIKGKLEVSANLRVSGKVNTAENGAISSVVITTEEYKTSDKLTLLEQSKRNYRHKLAHTICVCFSTFVMGWGLGLMGTAFPDLRMLIQEDLSTASWIFTCWSIGFVNGSVLCGIAYERGYRVSMLVLVKMVMCAGFAIVPWCDNVIAMFVVHVFIGIASGTIVTTATADIVFVWQEKARPYTQAMSGTVCLGAILSPIAAAPFLAMEIQQTGLQPDNFTAANVTNATTIAPTIPTTYSPPNATANASYMLLSGVDEPSANGEVIYGETHVYVAYYVSSGVCIAVASLYIIVHILYGSVYVKVLTPFGASHEGQKHDYFLTVRYQNICTAVLVCTIMFYMMCEITMSTFLMTFTVTSLEWTKANGSKAVSVFWLSFGTGRFVTIPITKKLSISTVFAIFLCILHAGGVLLWASVQFEVTILVWVAIVTIGFGMSPLFAMIISLASEKVRPLTGRLTALYFLGIGIGSMIAPVVIGALMEQVSLSSYVYFNYFTYAALTCCVVFILNYLNYLRRTIQASLI